MITQGSFSANSKNVSSVFGHYYYVFTYSNFNFRSTPCISLLCYRFLLSVIITDFFSFDNSLFGTKKCPLYSKSDGRYCLKNHLGKSFILILYMLK